MAGSNEQDKLADDWNPAGGTEGEGLSADWAAMLEADASKPAGEGADRVLNQDEIDSLLGFAASTSDQSLR